MYTRRVIGVAVVAAMSALVPAMADPAGAVAPGSAGHLVSVVQDTFAHRLHVTGWAYGPAKRAAPIAVKLYVDGSYVGHVVADDPSPNVDRIYAVRGRHAYSLTVRWTKTAHVVTAKTVAAPVAILASKAVRHYLPPASARIVSVAKRYVGKARYVEGGASPRGFDCSGYTKYIYAQARVRTLPHNAERQRDLKAMRHISAARAQPGDLVFYLGGGGVYHVAIYAGRGMQYAAATPADGIRYQKVWSSAVQYGTLTH